MPRCSDKSRPVLGWVTTTHQRTLQEQAQCTHRKVTKQISKQYSYAVNEFKHQRQFQQSLPTVTSSKRLYRSHGCPGTCRMVGAVTRPTDQLQTNGVKLDAEEAAIMLPMPDGHVINLLPETCCRRKLAMYTNCVCLRKLRLHACALQLQTSSCEVN